MCVQILVSCVRNSWINSEPLKKQYWPGTHHTRAIVREEEVVARLRIGHTRWIPDVWRSHSVAQYQVQLPVPAALHYWNVALMKKVDGRIKFLTTLLKRLKMTQAKYTG